MYYSPAKLKLLCRQLEAKNKCPIKEVHWISLRHTKSHSSQVTKKIANYFTLARKACDQEEAPPFKSEWYIATLEDAILTNNNIYLGYLVFKNTYDQLIMQDF